MARRPGNHTRRSSADLPADTRLTDTEAHVDAGHGAEAARQRRRAAGDVRDAIADRLVDVEATEEYRVIAATAQTLAVVLAGLVHGAVGQAAVVGHVAVVTTRGVGLFRVGDPAPTD